MSYNLSFAQGRRASEIFGGGAVDGGTEGPERGAEARSAGAPRGVGSGEGRRSPSPVWGSGGYAPRKFCKNQRLNRVFFGIFAS